MALNLDPFAGLIGITEEEARDKIRNFGGNLKVRIASRDGKEFVGTCDHKSDRFNLEINNGKVTGFWRG